jgi:Dolichyl-phosphate-mannose-protein mannosyltransferase
VRDVLSSPAPLHGRVWRGTRSAAARARLWVAANQLVAVAACGVFVAAGYLRLSDANWDQGQHLHPDERYISTVEDNIHWPRSPWTYFDVHTSPLSPYNTAQGADYVYGTLPLFAIKGVASLLGEDDYGRLNIVGRHLSALVDLGTLVLVFLLARLLLAALVPRRAPWGAILAAALYGFTVTAIQFSHFATVESWLVFFSTLTLYLSARACGGPVDPTQRIELGWAFVGVALGLTIACKVSGVVVGVAVGVAILGRLAVIARVVDTKETLMRGAAAGLVLVVPGYLAYRVVSPYTFASSFWLNLSINPNYHDALARQQAALRGEGLFPPAYQWLLSRPIWSPLENLVRWQLGPPFGVAAAIGVVLLAISLALPVIRAVRQRAWRTWRTSASASAIERLTLQAMLLAFILAAFFPFATLFAHTGRYLVPLVPALAVAAAYGVVVLLNRWPRVLVTVSAILVATTAAYAFAFHTIYDRTNTRLAASHWIVAHVPAGATIANEHWDDSLPVGGDAQRYRGETVPVFDPDDEAKMRKLYDTLGPADYYFLSSPRAWRTIGRLPDRFPLMVRFYRSLFAGQLGFEEVASFRSLPTLFGLKLDDLRAEEAFWVYDHPPVMIFRHIHRLSFAQFHRALCEPPAPSPCG